MPRSCFRDICFRGVPRQRLAADICSDIHEPLLLGRNEYTIVALPEAPGVTMPVHGWVTELDNVIFEQDIPVGTLLYNHLAKFRADATLKKGVGRELPPI